jgi:hypothetical protein
MEYFDKIEVMREGTSRPQEISQVTYRYKNKC